MNKLKLTSPQIKLLIEQGHTGVTPTISAAAGSNTAQTGYVFPPTAATVNQVLCTYYNIIVTCIGLISSSFLSCFFYYFGKISAEQFLWPMVCFNLLVVTGTTRSSSQTICRAIERERPGPAVLARSYQVWPLALLHTFLCLSLTFRKNVDLLRGILERALWESEPQTLRAPSTSSVTSGKSLAKFGYSFTSSQALKCAPEIQSASFTQDLFLY